MPGVRNRLKLRAESYGALQPATWGGLTSACSGPRVSMPLVVNLFGSGGECAAADAGR
jgi:hypothetical protein